MKKLKFFLIMLAILFCTYDFMLLSVIKVDLLENSGFKCNSQGHILVYSDIIHQRVFAPCLNTLSVTVIDAKTDRVFAVPVSRRIPRRLSIQGCSVNHKDCSFYIAGDMCLLKIDPIMKTSKYIPLPADLTSLAVDEKTGNVFMVGRLCGDMAIVEVDKLRTKMLRYGNKCEKVSWFAVSRPEPIRTVWIDSKMRRVYIIDGTNSTVYTIDADAHEILDSRKINVPEMSRWHWGGPDWEDNRFYLSLEDSRRRSRYALSIDLIGNKDVIIELPAGGIEPSIVSISTEKNELYIPYDNNDYIHKVSFAREPKVEEIKHNANYGIDSTIYDENTGRLFAASWAEGILYEIDTEKKEIVHHTPYLPVYPHMNSMVYFPELEKLYFPAGATAVNGTFGSIIFCLNIRSLEEKIIYTGWGPISIIENPVREGAIVFGSDNKIAFIKPDGNKTFKRLPYSYLHDAVVNPDNKYIYLAYGPHYTIFPDFYMKSMRGGIYKLNASGELLGVMQTDRLAQKILIDNNGFLWATENTWGEEEPRLTYLPLNESERWGKVMLPPSVLNECLLRGLKIDPYKGMIWVLRNGNLSNDTGLLQVVDPVSKELLKTYETGITPTDFGFVDSKVLVSNFNDNTVTVVDVLKIKKQGTIIKVGGGPLKLAVSEKDKQAYILNHSDDNITVIKNVDGKLKVDKTIEIPSELRFSNIFFDDKDGRLYITGHSGDMFQVLSCDSDMENFDTVLEYKYPYGEIDYSKSVASFGNRGQWGDALYEINRFMRDKNDCLWITDFLSGTVWIVDRNENRLKH